MSNFKTNDLIRLLNKGDVNAFDAIYQSYSNRVFGFVLRYIKQREDAKEIVQEVFIKIWESREKIDLHFSFDSFVFTLTYNTTIDFLRRRVNEQKYLSYLSSVQQITNADKIIDDIYFKELKGEVHTLLNELSPRKKEIYLLSRKKGLTHKEISEKLNISTNTVKNHLVKTLAFLKNKLEKSLL